MESGVYYFRRFTQFDLCCFAVVESGSSWRRVSRGLGYSGFLMSTTANKPTIVCLASYFKGADFIRQCHDSGWSVALVTREKVAGENWPLESITEMVTVRDDARLEDYQAAVTDLGRNAKINSLVALEEFDVINGGLIREHLTLPGMSGSKARIFRDKLLMRLSAKNSKINVPDFIHPLNYEEMNEFVDRVPAPWVLKPRSDVSAIGIKKLNSPEELRDTIHEYNARELPNERADQYVLERYVPGRVFHVDSLVVDGKPAFALANEYGKPPMDVAHGGGIFLSRTLKHGSTEERELFRLNRKLISAFGLERGATHAEFIKSAEDGKFYFLEIAARVGGAFIGDLFEAASGLNIWREWAKIELAPLNDSHKVVPERNEYAGIALCLARQEWPDTSAYDDPEICFRVSKPFHVGLIIRSPDRKRVEELLDSYARRFSDDFVAVAPPPEKVEH
jgi:ATP-grasp domain